MVENLVFLDVIFVVRIVVLLAGWRRWMLSWNNRLCCILLTSLCPSYNMYLSRDGILWRFCWYHLHRCHRISWRRWRSIRHNRRYCQALNVFGNSIVTVVFLSVACYFLDGTADVVVTIDIIAVGVIGGIVLVVVVEVVAVLIFVDIVMSLHFSNILSRHFLFSSMHQIIYYTLQRSLQLNLLTFCRSLQVSLLTLNGCLRISLTTLCRSGPFQWGSFWTIPNTEQLYIELG